jgi:hypothetical protein
LLGVLTKLYGDIVAGQRDLDAEETEQNPSENRRKDLGDRISVLNNSILLVGKAYVDIHEL